MKGIDIFCASQSSTSTLGGTTTMEGALSSSIQHRRGPAIDRYNPIIHDQSRLLKTLPPAPSNPQIQSNTVDYVVSSKIDNKAKEKEKEKEKKKEKQQKVGKKEEKRRSNVAIDDDDYAKSTTTSGDSILNWRRGRRSWSCMNPGGFISPPGSSRYLLSEKTLLNNVQPDSDSVPVPTENPKSDSLRKDESGVSVQQPSSSAPVPFQVVVLRVSLHCRGCEKKLRKHISTMEGVSSYKIEFAAKKVTVEGNVTALGVLASISKVKKNVQLWPSSSSSSTLPVVVGGGDDVPAAAEMKKTPEEALPTLIIM